MVISYCETCGKKIKSMNGSQQLRKNKCRVCKSRYGRERARRLLHQMPYEDFLRTMYWHQLRNKIINRDENICQHCGAYDNLQVHHLTYERRGMEFLEDLITLCADCHAKVHEKIEEPTI